MESTRRILAVIVLYKMRFEESQCLKALLQSLSADADLSQQIDLIVCDNTPYEQEVPAWFSGPYYRDTSNPGLAQWFNLGLRTASERNIPWLMLLDQDTHVTAQYLSEVLERARAMEAEREIAAVVPKLRQHGTVCSPLAPPTYRPSRPIDASFSGVASTTLHVFNSGSALRVTALAEAGGFPEEFPLDYLDHAMFAALQSRGGKVFVLQAMLEHDLSSNAVKREDAASAARHRSILLAERRFYRRTGSLKDRLYRRLRLLRGALGILIKHHAFASSLRMVQAALQFSVTPVPASALKEKSALRQDLRT